MKIAGYIFAVIGGLALIGGLAAGHSVFGPLFWLALGIVLIYFGKKKEETQEPAEENEKIDHHPTKAEESTCPSKNETQEIVNDKPMTDMEKVTDTGIDKIAQKVVLAFNTENAQMLKEETKEMLRQINYYESMFSIVKHPFLVAKSLYFMLTEDYLSEENQMSVIKLTYFCLLNNFLENCNIKSDDPKYEEFVSGCKLALVLISMQNQYLMYSVVAGQARYVNPDTHIRNQVLLFGGIAKEAETSHYNFPLEDVINRYYTNIFKGLNTHLPTGKDLASLKEKCIPVMKNIKTSISVNLNDRWSDDF